MDRPRKWQRLLKNLNHDKIPFDYIRSFKLTLEDGAHYTGNTKEDLHNIFLDLRKTSNHLFSKFSITFEPNYLKIKKEVQKSIEPLLLILTGKN